MNIQTIIDHEIIGNAYHDLPLMSMIHTFVCDQNNTMQDRCAALHKLDQVMGFDSPYPTEDDVNNYIQESI